MLFTVTTQAFADTEGTDIDNVSEALTAIQNLLTGNIVKAVCVICFIIVGITMVINQQAEDVKKRGLSILLGIIVIFAASTITGLIWGGLII